MKLFEIRTRSGRTEPYRRNKWLIVADSLFEALWRVPDEVTIEAVDVRPVAARTRAAAGGIGHDLETWRLETRCHEHALACPP